MIGMTWPNELLPVKFTSKITLEITGGMPQNDGRDCPKDWRRSSATGLAVPASTWTTSGGTPVPTRVQRLLSDFSAMRSSQGNSQPEDSRQVSRADIVDIGRPGDPPRWQPSSSHSNLLQRKVSNSETGI